ncbi:MAG: hypothetical protein C0599_08035 [Salinivirgaceae bacterium]|nr:MAG: hypothetical protein C0599_08035 [Salinivirgaceae bacterium]
MRIIVFAFVLSMIGISCGTQTVPVVEPDFNGSFWNDSPEKVLETVGLGEPKEYPDGLILQLEWEGDFLGATTNLDEGDVARMAYFFENQKLKGAWYYIMAPKTQINGQKYVEEMKSKMGEPTKVWEDAEMSKKFYLWQNDKTVVKMMVRDAGEKERFEWYNYEIGWFEANKDQILK